jgi:hypothetical protein
VQRKQNANNALTRLSGAHKRIRSYPWTTLADLKGDPEAVRAIQEVEKLIKELKKALRK